MNKLVLLAACLAAGCGGKIAPDSDIATDAGPVAEDSAAKNDDLTIDQACAVVCEDRDTRCGAVDGYPKKCIDECTLEANEPGCGMVAANWDKCFAKNIADATCKDEPLACRPAYCEYIACHSSPSAPRPDYCY